MNRLVAIRMAVGFGLLSAVATSAFCAGNDKDNFVGDQVRFPVNIQASKVDVDGTATVLCFPANTSLWGLGSNNGTDEKTQGTLFRTSDSKSQTVKTCNTPPIILSQSTKILVLDKDVKGIPINRTGLTYGALAVPYKYQLTGKKDLSGSATIGPYLGYRTSSSTVGVEVDLVAFLGAADIAVAQTINGAITTQNVAGFSYGVGILSVVKGNFQLGGVLGYDRVSSSANYEYNGKPWIAFELGYSFMQ